MIEAGKLNRKGDIQRRVLTPDEFGEDVESWVDLVTDVWAQIMPISARGYVHGEQLTDDITHIIRFRYVAGLVATDRFMYDGRVFNFSSAPIDYKDGHYMTEVRAIEVLSEPVEST
jgi:SPP1 family predicted phage head-tail adaptor